MIGNRNKIINWLLTKDENIDFEIKEFHQKRSLNANAYAWALIGKIADVLRTSKDEVYLTMLKRYGQSEIISVLSNVNIDKYFKYFEVFGHSNLNNKDFTHYKIFKGSSEFNSKEMAVLIDGIVSEANELNIPTLEEYKLNKIIKEWGNDRK